MTPSLDAFRAFADRLARAADRAATRERLRLRPPSERDALATRLDADATHDAAEDRVFVTEVADAMRHGTLRGQALASACSVLCDRPLGDGPFLGDEPLDALLEALLDTHGRYDGRPPPGAGLIHYDPSPAALTLELAARDWFSAGSVFVDVGSGTGRVTTLAALLGTARVVALELDAELVAVSRASAERLGARVEHRHGDARTAALDDATDAFFFAPFVGPVLDEVVDRLLTAPSLRRVGSWGPATAQLAAHRGLRACRHEPYGPFDLATFRPWTSP